MFPRLLRALSVSLVLCLGACATTPGPAQVSQAHAPPVTPAPPQVDADPASPHARPEDAALQARVEGLMARMSLRTRWAR